MRGLWGHRVIIIPTHLQQTRNTIIVLRHAEKNLQLTEEDLSDLSRHTTGWVKEHCMINWMFA